MKALILPLFLCLWLIDIHGRIFRLLIKSLVTILCYLVVEATIDCSNYSNDMEIVVLNPFFVRIDLKLNPLFTSAERDNALNVKKLLITNDRNPS